MAQHKISRNDPCPCGSGRKYKHCCQQREATQASTSRSQHTLIPDAIRAALTHHQAGRFPQAEAIYRQILQTAPRQPDALHLLGALALRDGNIEPAISLINKAIGINSSNPEYYCNLGLALHEQGKLDDAVRNYRKALALKPDYADAYYNLHALLLNQEDMAPSIRCLQKAIAINPFDADAGFMLGMLLDYSGATEAATSYFLAAGNTTGLLQARLDAWCYIKSAGLNLPLITGSMMQTFRLGFEAAARHGLVLEFGVRHGNTIRQIAMLADQEVHGFDSFEGLPEVWHHEPKGSYTTKGEIPKVPNNVSLHVGWFEDTLPDFLQKFDVPVRFMNIDCDIYSSARTVLELLAPRIMSGTVIVFDEYIGNEHWREDEFKAFQEAVASNGWTYETLCFSFFTKQVAVRIV